MDREIYFAECCGRVKVGITINVQSRLSQLRQGAGGPVTLIASVAGDFALERALHKKLKAHRQDREWYRDCPEVRATIQNCLNNFPPPTQKEARARTAKKFKAICKILWPDSTAEALADIGGTDVRTGARWLAGISEPPAIIIAAIIVEITKRE
jgi:hypothetical protein